LPFDAEDYVHRIGRTARLGAEGDAISFACELYAPSLPDIEAFIQQKLPVEPITADLFQAQPRPHRDAPQGESIAEVFDQVRRDAKAADGGRGGRHSSGSGGSGGGRGGSSSGGRSGIGGSSSGRSGSGSAPRDASAPAKPRVERPIGDAPAARDAPVRAAEVPSASVVANVDPAAAERPARKRRRRRGGRPLDGDGGNSGRDSQSAAPVAETASAPLLTRVKSRLRNWLNRLPGRGRPH